MYHKEKLTEFAALKLKYTSHVGTGNGKDISSDTYYSTESGQMKQDCWVKEVKDLIEKHKESDISEKLKEYIRNELEWMKYKYFRPGEEDSSEKNELYEQMVEREALRFHTMRLFEDEAWLGKEVFEKVYMNEEVMQLSLV